RRCLRKSSARSRAKAGGRRMKRARPTSGPQTKPATQAARAARSAVAEEVASSPRLTRRRLPKPPMTTGRRIVRTERDARSMAATLEAANNGRTGSHGLSAGARGSGERPRTNRVFKDIHGAESHHPNTVIIDRDLGGNTAGDDNVLRRHWVVVCTHRRSAAPRKVVG